MSLNEPWMKRVGAAILEIQLGGRVSACGTGVGAKRVSNQGLLVHPDSVAGR